MSNYCYCCYFTYGRIKINSSKKVEKKLQNSINYNVMMAVGFVFIRVWNLKEIFILDLLLLIVDKGDIYIKFTFAYRRLYEKP